MKILTAPGPQVATWFDVSHWRVSAANEAETAVAVHEWARRKIRSGPVLGRRTLADTSSADILTARYTALLLRLPNMPLTFESLCLLHRDLFTDLDAMAGRPRTDAIMDVDGFALPETAPSNASPAAIPHLAQVVFDTISGEDVLLGTDRATFIARAAEFATDLLNIAPFTVGNGITVRLLLTALSRSAGHSLTFAGASQLCVCHAFADAMTGDHASLIQLLDAAARPLTAVTNAAPSVRLTLLRGNSIAFFAKTLAKQHGIVFEQGPVTAFTDAGSRLADSEVIFDKTQQLLTALGRAKIITAHDGIMLHAAYLRQIY